MKFEKQIEKLEEIDFLMLFSFQNGECYDKDIMSVCNYVILKNLKNYKEIKKFLLNFYKDLNKTLKEINEELNKNEYKYGYEINKHLIFMKKIIEEHLGLIKYENKKQ